MCGSYWRKVASLGILGLLLIVLPAQAGELAGEKPPQPLAEPAPWGWVGSALESIKTFLAQPWTGAEEEDEEEGGAPRAPEQAGPESYDPKPAGFYPGLDPVG